MMCTAGSSGERRPPWEVLPSRRPIVHRPSADCEDDPEPGTPTSTSRKKGLAQGAAIRRHHHSPLAGLISTSPPFGRCQPTTKAHEWAAYLGNVGSQEDGSCAHGGMHLGSGGCGTQLRSLPALPSGSPLGPRSPVLVRSPRSPASGRTLAS